MLHLTPIFTSRLHLTSVKRTAGLVFNVRIGCFSVSFMKINEESLCFGLLFGQKKHFEDTTFDSGKLSSAFLAFFLHIME